MRVPGGIEICDLLEIRSMHFRWPHNPSPQKVIKEIEEILTDALTILSYNADLITDEEQNSFSEEFSRLINVRVELKKRTAYHRLTEVRDECKLLKQRLKQACKTHREENFRMGFLAAAAV